MGIELETGKHLFLVVLSAHSARHYFKLKKKETKKKKKVKVESANSYFIEHFIEQSINRK